MKNLNLLTLAFFVLFLNVPSAHADPSTDVPAKARQVVEEMKNGRLVAPTQDALNRLVKQGVRSLRKKGYVADAEAFEAEWSAHYANYFTSFQSLDLGDHEPVSAWLARFYSRIESRLGGFVCHISRFDDLKIFNFAIPVVFQPNGNPRTGDTWDEGEYRKHFVPFSGAVVYWSAHAACSAAAAMPMSLGCGLVAEAPRFAVENWAAPRISDYVYNQARHKANPGETEAVRVPDIDVDRLF